MKRLFFGISVMMVCFAFAKPVTMMTYNVQIGAGLNDPYNFPKGSLGHLPQVAEVIRAANPDWVAIQEIDRNVGRTGFVDQTQELAKMCGMKGTFFPKVMRFPKRFVAPNAATDEECASGSAYGLALLSKEEPLSIRKVMVPGYYHPRCIAFAEFRDYVVACTHFPLKGDDAMVAARVALMNVADYHKPVFLAGDFNFELGSAPISSLQQGMTILNDASINTYPSDIPKKCIDFIMVDNPHTNRVVVTERRVIADKDASDHCAVIVKVDLLEVFAASIALVPAPREQVWREGTCTFAEKDIRFARDAALPPEGYRLDIKPDGVTVTSADDAGAFYAKKTLKQLGTNAVPCGTVTDAPAFKWRGFMLDEGRHFFGKETVKDLLDLMADHKLNVFHWHLTEDQGWRLAIDRFPELVKYGSVRPESPVHGCTGRPKDYRGNGQPYGPYFYTAADVREILAYAKERFITVVPEIEVPGHIRALLAAHPEFACREGLPRVPRTMNGIEDDVLCAGNDEAIRFMEQIYDEVCALFPGTYIHIGGDECRKKRWKNCPKCQARIKALGLKDEDELQAWVTRHFTDYLAKKGRRTIGWDEILAGNPGLETVVHNWRKPEYGIEAAEKGHDVVVSALEATYFSVAQGVKEDPFTYLSPNRRCSLSAAYAFDPHAGMTETAKRHVLGAECCMWSECVWNEYDLAFKLWPRACAFAEAVWTCPAAPRDFADFARRMTVHRRRLISQGVNCAPLD